MLTSNGGIPITNNIGVAITSKAVPAKTMRSPIVKIAFLSESLSKQKRRTPSQIPIVRTGNIRLTVVVTISAVP